MLLTILGIVSHCCSFFAYKKSHEEKFVGGQQNERTKIIRINGFQ